MQDKALEWPDVAPIVKKEVEHIALILFN